MYILVKSVRKFVGVRELIMVYIYATFLVVCLYQK